MWKRYITRLTLENAARTIFRIESDKSSVTSWSACAALHLSFATQRLHHQILFLKQPLQGIAHVFEHLYF